MTNREMLKFAAKAAGLHVGFERDGEDRGRYDLYWSIVHNQLVWHGKSTGSEYPRPIFWNPLIDDGDALRLAVKLGIEIIPDLQVNEVRTAFMVGSYGYNTAEEIGTDPLAATRRAIVRAAAEIGRRMK